ncbi:hypothetical protein BC834DRAFT_692276 [Gloeopeniophorella convolvens]|nr:hypothetical protein BC834DRAFT_692276 [Gloeopeniophorella convolvens]
MKEEYKGLPTTTSFARLRQFCLCVAGATLRFVTGRPLNRLPVASSSRAICYERSPGKDYDCDTDLTQIMVQPYFVLPTATASEILVNVAVQDMLAQEELQYYEPSCHPPDPSPLSTVPNIWDTVGFYYPFEYPEPAGQASKAIQEEVNYLAPEVLVYTSPDAVITFRSTPSEPVDDEDRIIIPVTYADAPSDRPIRRTPARCSLRGSHRMSFTTANYLYAIDEDGEDEVQEEDREDEDDLSDTETIRPSSMLGFRPLDPLRSNGRFRTNAQVQFARRGSF